MAAPGQTCWPPAGSYATATGQDLMAADNPVSKILGQVHCNEGRRRRPGGLLLLDPNNAYGRTARITRDSDEGQRRRCPANDLHQLTETPDRGSEGPVWDRRRWSGPSV